MAKNDDALENNIRSLMAVARLYDEEYQAELNLAEGFESVAVAYRDANPGASGICDQYIGKECGFRFQAKWRAVHGMSEISEQLRKLDKARGVPCPVRFPKPGDQEPHWLDFPHPVQSFLEAELAKRNAAGWMIVGEVPAN